MPRKRSPQPTQVELEILKVLWELGPSSVRRVHDALLPGRDTGYSTTLKMMQVMTQKGLLLKDDSQRPQLYEPAFSRNDARTSMLDDLIERAFGGATENLILHAVESGSVSPKELARIKQLIQSLEKGAQR